MESVAIFTDNQIKAGLVVSVVSLLVLYKTLSNKKSKLPPGPKGWPLLGNMLGMKLRPF